MFLHVGKYPRLIPGTGEFVADGVMDAFFQLSRRAVALADKSVKVDQRSYEIETPAQHFHIRCEPAHGHIAAACFPPGPANQYRCGFHMTASQMFREYALDEFLLGLTLHRYRNPGHGRPPIRFFCHSSPVEYSFSQSRYSLCLTLRISVCPFRSSSTTISSRPNASTSNGD